MLWTREQSTDFWHAEVQKYPALSLIYQHTTCGRAAVLCERCGCLVNARSYHAHINTPHCMARTEAVRAIRDGYVPWNDKLAAGSTPDFALPFTRVYKSDLVVKNNRAVQCEIRWMAAWWAELALRLDAKLPHNSTEFLTRMASAAADKEELQKIVTLAELALDE